MEMTQNEVYGMGPQDIEMNQYQLNQGGAEGRTNMAPNQSYGVLPAESASYEETGMYDVINDRTYEDVPDHRISQSYELTNRTTIYYYLHNIILAN